MTNSLRGAPLLVAASPSKTRAWGVTGLLLIFMLINFADKAVLGLSAVSIMKELGLTPGTYGLVASAFFLLFSIAALVVGHVADRVRTKWVLLAMALGWSVCQFPMLVPIAGFWTLLITRVLLGAAEGPAYPVANHAAHKWFPDRDRDLVSGILTAGAPIGVIIAAPTLTWVIAEHGWRIAFAILGGVGLVWALVWMFVGAEGPVRDRLRPEEVAPEPFVSLEGSVEDERQREPAAPEPGTSDVPRVPTWRILATGTWVASVVGGFAAYWSLSLLVAWVPPYLSKVLGYGTQQIGNVVTLPWALMAVGMVVQGLIIRRLTRRGISTRWSRGALGGGCVIVAGLATLGMLLVGPGWAKIALLTVGFSVGSLVIAIGQASSAEICPSGQRGGVLGAYAAVYSISGVIAPALTGWLIGSAPSPTSGFTAAFTVTGLLLVAAGVLVAVLVRPGRDRARLAALATGTSRGGTGTSHESITEF